MIDHVVSVNVGGVTQVPYRGKIVSTGIFKGPAQGRVLLRAAGFDGDTQADPSVHGGAHRAAYVYSTDAYDWWRTQLGHDLQPGEFGENLTVTGFRDEDVQVGDTLRVGNALVQVTTPREPCFKLGIRMGDHRFPARFREASRMGFYVRVLEEGDVGVGDTVEPVTAATGSVTIAEFHRTYVDGRDDLDALRRLLASPRLEPSWAEWCERRIAEASLAD